MVIFDAESVIQLVKVAQIGAAEDVAKSVGKRKIEQRDSTVIREFVGRN